MRIPRKLFSALAFLTVAIALLLGVTVLAERPNSPQPDLACFEPELPDNLGRDTLDEARGAEARPAEPPSEPAGYQLIQNSVSLLSTPGDAPFVHGRQDVLENSDLIRRYAPQELELIVAASIAHQASDVKDRPFGADSVETFWLENVDPDASVGIAQLRASEVVYWAPRLVGADLLDPEIAVRVMTAKLAKANQYISRTYPDVSISDRMMLLALVQNDSTEIAMRRTIDPFFRAADRNWEMHLSSNQARSRDWTEQLRLVLVQLDWLVSEGWAMPAGVDRDRWAEIAFSAPDSERPDDRTAVQPGAAGSRVARRR